MREHPEYCTQEAYTRDRVAEVTFRVHLVCILVASIWPIGHVYFATTYDTKPPLPASLAAIFRQTHGWQWLL